MVMVEAGVGGRLVRLGLPFSSQTCHSPTCEVG